MACTDIDDKANTLRSLISLLADAAEVVIKEWKIEAQDSKHDPLLPSVELYHARQEVVGACGMFSNLVQEPQHRLMEVSFQYFISRALHIAARANLAKFIAEADTGLGVELKEISVKSGIEQSKLAQIFHVLCSTDIFTEIKPGFFANNEISRQLTIEPMRCVALLHGLSVYAGSVQLPTVLLNSVENDKNRTKPTAYEEMHGTTIWEYLQRSPSNLDDTVDSRRELEIFAQAMVGAGRVHATPVYAGMLDLRVNFGAILSLPFVQITHGNAFRMALLSTLAEELVMVLLLLTFLSIPTILFAGGMSLDLAKRFPRLHFVVQDLPAVIPQAEAVWQRELPDAVATKRVRFMPHDFLTEQPIKGADVYLMRYVLHNWRDEQCIMILSKLRDAMGPQSRILDVDQIMRTTVGSTHLQRAPEPLPANYGHAQLLSHAVDIAMLSLFNSKERTPEEFISLAQQAGLRVVKVWECRTIVGVTEMRRNDAPVN
ncbi:uncharacterized protein FIBRA_00638 [Fibroporia radiculosa]|uniref:O-methyltransferase C-terminal domain-containing protein n=1 Tax=Fibroporia radiculosa TaxID=599839 RepID=J4I818_9APHY|nr:uncharacterized protein FIBRA_00638 [Fibroporia radiculosa]CCL98636.1 predicted protein [Fibroporia radiculosa]